MRVSATAKYIRMSPRKLRLVTELEEEYRREQRRGLTPPT